MIDKLIDAVRKLATANPDTHYAGSICCYASGNCSNGSTGCIVGQALVSLGVDVVPLDQLEDIPNAGGALETLGIRFEEDQGQWLNVVQAHQDKGDGWAVAIKSADNN